VAVLDNKLFRLRVDDAAESMAAEQWDDAGGAWTPVSLGASSWVPEDYDLYRVAPAEAVARIRFRDTSDGSTYALDASLKRGARGLRFTRPPNEGDITPDGLVDLLSPAAVGGITDPNESLGLRARSEVRA
jgi:hypothetical protein